MVTTPYILANCTMQQSVNGNNKHKVNLVEEEVDNEDHEVDEGGENVFFSSWQ